MKILRATLTAIAHETDEKIVGQVQLLDESTMSATPVVFELVYDTTDPRLHAISVRKDGVVIQTATRYSARSFRCIGKYRARTYWMIWNIVREARPTHQWTVPTVMRFSFRERDYDLVRRIMEPNKVAPAPAVCAKSPPTAPTGTLVIKHEPLQFKAKPLKLTQQPLVLSTKALPLKRNL